MRVATCSRHESQLPSAASGAGRGEYVATQLSPLIQPTTLGVMASPLAGPRHGSQEVVSSVVTRAGTPLMGRLHSVAGGRACVASARPEGRVERVRSAWRACVAHGNGNGLKELHRRAEILLHIALRRPRREGTRARLLDVVDGARLKLFEERRPHNRRHMAAHDKERGRGALDFEVVRQMHEPRAHLVDNEEIQDLGGCGGHAHITNAQHRRGSEARCVTSRFAPGRTRSRVVPWGRGEGGTHHAPWHHAAYSAHSRSES